MLYMPISFAFRRRFVRKSQLYALSLNRIGMRVRANWNSRFYRTSHMTLG